jgi:hypothetical protein
MRSLVYPTRKNRVQAAALVLFVVALVIPQLAWADHASDHPYSQFDDPSLVSTSEGYAALAEKYKTGELVYNAPGRRDDRSFSISPSKAYYALVEKYKTGELVYNAPGRRDGRSFATSDNLGPTDAAFLAANPEIMAFRRYGALQQGVTAAASSARWVALGNYYMEKSERAAAADSARWVALGSVYTSGNAAFLSENPEIMAFRRFVGQQDCSAPGLQC